MCVLIVILAFIITHKTAEVNPHSASIRKTTQIDSRERFVYNRGNSLWVSDYEVVTQSKQSINRYSTLIRYSSHQCLIGEQYHQLMRTPQYYVNTSLCFDTSHSQWSICLDSHSIRQPSSSWQFVMAYRQLFCILMCCYVPPLWFKND